jgi:Holliday junction resolvase
VSRRVGQVRRRDAVEQPIVEALEAVGAHVTRISGKGAPDLLVRLRGHVFAAEVKSGKGKQTAAQQASQWPIWRSVEDALKAVGIGRNHRY